jgi:hypothetical protein
MAALGLITRPLRYFLNDTLGVALSAAKLYFRPFLWIVNPYRNNLSLLAQGAHEFSERELLRLIQAVICFNQGALIEYNFLIADKHKAMKNAYLMNAKSRNLKALTNDLMNYLNKDFLEITFKNFDFAHSYFALRSKIIPRICIKGNFIVDDSQTVVSIFRDDRVPYNSDTEVDKNVAFSSIKKNGRYYLENNIPEAVLYRNYINPRLDVSRIKSDAVRGKRINQISADWDQYWFDYKSERKGDASFYRSTLIVPLTLWNNDLSLDFKKKVRYENIDRSIFGFLCFDHRDAGFFQEVDISVGYIFAALLCIYVFDRIAVTDASETFAKVKERLRQQNQSLEIDDLSLEIDDLSSGRVVELLKDVPRIKMPTSDPEETETNRLIPIDALLLNSVRPDIGVGVK